MSREASNATKCGWLSGWPYRGSARRCSTHSNAGRCTWRSPRFSLFGLNFIRLGPKVFERRDHSAQWQRADRPDQLAAPGALWPAHRILDRAAVKPRRAPHLSPLRLDLNDQAELDRHTTDADDRVLARLALVKDNEL